MKNNFEDIIKVIDLKKGWQPWVIHVYSVWSHEPLEAETCSRWNLKDSAEVRGLDLLLQKEATWKAEGGPQATSKQRLAAGRQLARKHNP